MKMKLLLIITLFGIMGFLKESQKADLANIPNVMVNPGFESAKSGWEACPDDACVTPDSFTHIGSNGFNAYASWDADGVGARFRPSDHIGMPIPLRGKACYVRVYVENTGGAAGDYELAIEDISNNALITNIPIPVNASWQVIEAGFTCPVSNFRPYMVSTAASTTAIQSDNWYAGRDYRIGPVNDSAELMAHARYDGVGGCGWTILTIAASTWTDFPIDTGCPAPTVISTASGVSIDTTDDDLPTLVFDEALPVGKYTMEATLSATGNNTADDFISFCVTETGADPAVHGGCAGMVIENSSKVHSAFSSYSFEITSPVTKTFKIQALVTDNTVDPELINNDDGKEMTFKLYRYPTQSPRDTVTLETQDLTFSVRKNATQTSLVDNSFVQVEFNNELFDPSNSFDPVLYRYTAKRPGKYLFNWQVLGNSTTNRQIVKCFSDLYKNGSTHKRASYWDSNGTDLADSIAGHGSIIVDANVGDYFEVFSACDVLSGTWRINDSIATYFSGAPATQGLTQAVALVGSAHTIPTGSMMPFAATSAPDGWLLADGSSVSRSTYADLFAAIGTAYGTVDGNTFNLPDTRGKFLRGVAGGEVSDPDRASRIACNTGGATGDNVGSCQSSELKSHGHADTFSANQSSHLHGIGRTSARANPGASGGSGLYMLEDSPTGTFNSNSTDPSITVSGSVTDAGGNESRPINIYVNYIIKT
jgi:microcystin-dependent protein